MRREIDLDAFVVMPNHFHGVVVLLASDAAEANERLVSGDSPVDGIVGASGGSPLRQGRFHGIGRRSLGSFIAGFKSGVTRRINQECGATRSLVWQRNYDERIIRDERELTRIRAYIAANPANWANDSENPAAMSRRDR